MKLAIVIKLQALHVNYCIKKKTMKKENRNKLCILFENRTLVFYNILWMKIGNLGIHVKYFLWHPDKGKKAIDSKIKWLYCLSYLCSLTLSIKLQTAQLAFQLPRGLFSWARHVAWMIYFQYTNILISNKFVFWINWKYKIMTVMFALFVSISIVYIY